MVFITDPVYRGLLDEYSAMSLISRYEIGLRDNEDFSRPRKLIEKTLRHIKAAGCNSYVVLIANGLLASQFLQYAEGERLLDTRGYFLLFYDSRLLRPELHYIWNRIVNVVFVRRYSMYKYRSGERIFIERIDLATVYYPSRERDVTEMKYIDTWYDGKLRYGNDHYLSKTTNLHGNGLRVAVFEHIPAVTETSREYYEQNSNGSSKALGVEFELIQVIARAMNFKANYYIPLNIENEKWGKAGDNDSYGGLLGEAINGNADFFLGDLHYTVHHLNYLDLSTPYNTECLTFLTPEALTDNSWKLLILPFRPNAWIAVFFVLLMSSGLFYLFALLYQKYIISYKYMISTTNEYDSSRDLCEFTDLQSSLLYTYSMQLQVSLPRLPDAWSMRVLIGWWWIFTILVAVIYRASMTATLANPFVTITIDTLAQLTRASLPIGGWNEESRNFFLASTDPHSQEIGSKFELAENEKEAVDRVANGTFCYYENSYLLRHLRAKEIFEKARQKNKSEETGSMVKYHLHIMEECVVHMPIALGLEKNSPLKSHVDILVSRMIEIGLVGKWLSDVMEWSKITESRQKTESETALVDLPKLYAAFVALAIGYCFSSVALLGEILHWKYVVLRDPAYDKYHLDTFYKNNHKFKT
ncbi:PREDICTED: glutamate receptor ionotropic, NMDA 3A-like isoform X2 [Dinoponera quadriceps]|nr:PREDICTED: glutamate receptor ionotropic, NMDA 3A-like isoform X2 [Dinoponera quadriceps]XP_014483348.1 PREDICTED: glutamate receptor ionotropic, NMDA 3A-like isoform X2 [Dinoponera quadriceps]XP_014483349.1 PREDICTED: glutamate receptor ionotropic, NMDA 3A-like isoform X2 [Dinoponera quadriceps]